MMRRLREGFSLKRVAITLSCTLVLAAAAGFTPASAVVETEMDVSARAWVEAHSTALPQTLGELAAYPKVYRRYIFNKLPVDVKVKVARQHYLDLVASNRVPLSDAQRSFLTAYAERLQPPSNPRPVPTSSVSPCARTKQIFPNIEQRHAIAMANLGDFTAPMRTWQSDFLQLGDTFRGIAVATLGYAVKAQDEGFPRCQCTVNCDCPALGLRYCNLNNEERWVCKPRQPGETFMCVDYWDFECLTGDYIECTGKCSWLWDPA